MSFVDEYLDELVPGFPCNTSPRFSTSINIEDSGGETRNRNWAHPLFRFTIPDAVREQATFEALYRHWLVMGGPESTFPFRDPLDFATRGLDYPNVEPGYAGTDQVYGTGDGTSRFFQLCKTYTVGANSYERPIYLPRSSDLALTINGLALTTPDPTLPGGPYVATVTRPGGMVEFDHPPRAGQTLAWGGYFDVEVRFEADDTFDGIVQSYNVSGFSDLTLVEVRRC